MLTSENNVVDPTDCIQFHKENQPNETAVWLENKKKEKS
jgi:hypothetical protein